MDFGHNFGAFTMFLGVALSITAFPVLARILAERKLLNTEVQAAKSHLPIVSAVNCTVERRVVCERNEVEINHLTSMNDDKIQ